MSGPPVFQTFRFVSFEWQPATCRVALHYALDDLPFVEEIVFEGATSPTDGDAQLALERCLRHLHLAAGVSYYKAALPPEIVVENAPLTRSTAAFFEDLYLHGLGELAFNHKIDLRGGIRFPSTETSNTEKKDGDNPGLSQVRLPRRTAVPVGGGKDSIVTIEALKAANEPMVLFSVGDYEPIRATAAAAGVERIVVRRRISKALLDLNRRGAINGHVPISAIIAFITAAAAVLYGFDAAALSNERSADEPNLVWNGWPINHQYSKSSAFETAFDELIRNDVLPGFRYFSFLRPLSELAITAAFSRVDPVYRKVFRSCNTAFRLDEARRGTHWCGDCPKCRFVFLALAPFMKRHELVDIFGADLLNDESQIDGFAELLELDNHKPFECVGEVRECRAAFVHIGDLAGWQTGAVVKALLPRLDRATVPSLTEILQPREASTVPQRFRSMLPAIPEPRHGD